MYFYLVIVVSIVAESPVDCTNDARLFVRPQMNVIAQVAATEVFSS